MKKLMLASAIALIAFSCSKKEETPVVEEVEVVETTKIEVPITEEVISYMSEDGNTKFSVTYNAEQGTAVVKNETSGETYEMTNTQTASGAKYEDKDGNFFWTHQGEFGFGKGKQDLVRGKEVK